MRRSRGRCYCIMIRVEWSEMKVGSEEKESRGERKKRKESCGI